MSQKLLIIFLFLSLGFSSSAQLCPYCVYEIIFNENAQFWEDPDGVIYGADEVLVPNKNGIWIFFEIDDQYNRTDLFTRDVICADGSIIRSRKDTDQHSGIYPNPTRNKLIVDAPFEEFSLVINSIGGTRVIAKNYTNYLEDLIILNTSELNPGIYILNIYSKNDQVNHLFVVQ